MKKTLRKKKEKKDILLECLLVSDNKIINKEKIAIALNEYFVNIGPKPASVACLMDLTKYTPLNQYTFK